MPRRIGGSIIGATNVPSVAAASGIWTLAEKELGGTGQGIASGGNNTYEYTDSSGIEYRILVFTSVGILTVTTAGVFDIFMVGQGGGGSSQHAAGGGAGAVLWAPNFGHAGSGLAVGNYDIYIGITTGTYPNGAGHGGAGADTSSQGEIGGSTTLNEADEGVGGGSGILMAYGGGGAGGYTSGSDSAETLATVGGSSGGGGSCSGGTSLSQTSLGTLTGGHAHIATDSLGPHSTYPKVYGSIGGAGTTANNNAGGGGGGAGAVGGAATNLGGTPTHIKGVGGAGGDGVTDFLNNTADTSAFLYAAQVGTNSANAAMSGLGADPGTSYIGGGGAGSHYGTTAIAAGGKGGGGAGRHNTNLEATPVAGVHTAGISGLDNTGGGGSSANHASTLGGEGGSGVVIVRYRLSGGGLRIG